MRLAAQAIQLDLGEAEGLHHGANGEILHTCQNEADTIMTHL